MVDSQGLKQPVVLIKQSKVDLIQLEATKWSNGKGSLAATIISDTLYFYCVIILKTALLLTIINYYYRMSTSTGVQERIKKSIERTLLPNLNAKAGRFRIADLHYFYKIKRNLKLEDWQRERDKQNVKQKFNRTLERFSISPRLKILSQHRVSPSKVQSKAKSFYLRPLCNKKQQNFNESYFNQNTFFFIKQDYLEYNEQDNFQKNINGTTLDTFSEQVIYEKIKHQQHIHQNNLANPISLTR